MNLATFALKSFRIFMLSTGMKMFACNAIHYFVGCKAKTVLVLPHSLSLFLPIPNILSVPSFLFVSLPILANQFDSLQKHSTPFINKWKMKAARCMTNIGISLEMARLRSLTVLKMCSNFGLIAKQNSILYALRLSILLNFANGRKQELYMTDESKLLWIVW